MAKIEWERTITEDIADRIDDWELAHSILGDHFESFGPYDVLSMIRYLKTGETHSE